jgi:imidazolonepropionase-like amidohydrolase
MTPRPLLAALVVSLPLALNGQAPTRTVAITNVNLIAMDRDGVQSARTILIREGRIAEIGESSRVEIPAGAERIDGTGKWLMPGLAEMHAHIPPGQATIEDMRRMLELNVLNGVTFVRGMLGDPRHLDLRTQAARGDIVSPLISTSGPSFNGNTAKDPATAAAMVAQQKAAGYDLLKIHPGVRRDAFDALAAAADRAGIRFAGHVPLDVGLARALEARYHTIDHVDGYVEALVRDGAPVKAADSQWFGVNLAEHLDESRIPALVAATRTAGTWIVPTQTLFESTIGDITTDVMTAWPEMKWAAPAQVTQWSEWKRKFVQDGPSTADGRAKFLQMRRTLIKALHSGGAGMLLGADAPQMWNVPGFATHRELQAMVRAGLTPAEALAMGTRNVARFYGDGHPSGIIAPGKRADLVLLGANPLDDVSNTTRVEGVAIGGKWLSKAAIEKRLAELAIAR